MPGMRGINGTANYNSAGGAGYGEPTWANIILASAVKPNPKWKEGDGTTRAFPVEMTGKTIMQLELALKVRSDLTDTGFITLADALATYTVLDMLILNGPINTNGVRGWRFDAQVFEGPEDQDVDKILYHEFTLKPTISANGVYKVVIAAGAPVYTLVGS